MDPVIYCVMSCLSLLQGLPQHELQRLPQAAVVAVDEAALWHMHSRRVAPVLLYFSAADYRWAVDRLSPDEAALVVARRHASWSPQALGEAGPWLMRRQRDAAALAMQARRANPALRAALDEQVLADVVLHARLGGEGRFGGSSLAELMQITLEHEARVLAEWDALPTASQAAAPAGAELAELREATQWLARALAAHGQPAFAQQPLQVEPWRGVHLSPADRTLQERLKADGEPWVPWRGGLVVRQRQRELGALRQQGLTVQTLYLDDGQFTEDAAELTPAQLARQFDDQARRLAADPAGAMARHLDDLRWQGLDLWVNLRARAVGQPALQQAITERLARRAGALQAASTLAPSAGSASVPALDAWRAAEGRLQADIAVLARLASLQAQAQAPVLTAWAQSKQAQLDAWAGAIARRP